MPAVSPRAAESVANGDKKKKKKRLGLHCLGDTDPSHLNTVDIVGGPDGVPHKGGGTDVRRLSRSSQPGRDRCLC